MTALHLTIPAAFDPATHHAWSVELTDTYAGEANYGWVRRGFILTPHGTSDRAIVRRAKAALGITGLRCRTAPMGGTEGWELRPHGQCMVAFITFADV